jgi:hypothetical protein
MLAAIGRPMSPLPNVMPAGRIAKAHEHLVPFHVAACLSPPRPSNGIEENPLLKSMFLPLGAMSLLLTGCVTQNQSTTARTATEELLISSSADRAAEKLAQAIPPASNVFIDTTNFDALDGKYAIGAIRDAIVRHGDRLLDDKKVADAVIELRSGASAINQDETLVGIPSFSVPIPLAGSLALPKIALYDKATQQGVAKFGATAINPKTGQLLASAGPQFGYAHQTKYTALLFFSWHKDDFIPDNQKDNFFK